MTIHPALNRSWLSSKLGVSRSFLSQVENGKRPMPKDKAEKLAEILNEIAQDCTSEQK